MEVIYRFCFHTKSPYAPVQFKTLYNYASNRQSALAKARGQSRQEIPKFESSQFEAYQLLPKGS